MVDEIGGDVAVFEEVALDHGAGTHETFVEDEEDEEKDAGGKAGDDGP